jgi:hypothetical protein
MTKATRRAVTPLALMTFARLPGWEERLHALIEERRHRAFAWGSHDCGLFAADAVLGTTGQDFCEGLRTYKSALGASRVLQAHGCADVVDLVINRGFPGRQHPLDARRGDIVCAEGGNGMTLGVVCGVRFAWPAPDGLMFLPIDKAARAWRVG